MTPINHVFCSDGYGALQNQAGTISTRYMMIEFSRTLYAPFISVGCSSNSLESGFIKRGNETTRIA